MSLVYGYMNTTTRNTHAHTSPNSPTCIFYDIKMKHVVPVCCVKLVKITTNLTSFTHSMSTSWLLFYFATALHHG